MRFRFTTPHYRTDFLPEPFLHEAFHSVDTSQLGSSCRLFNEAFPSVDTAQLQYIFSLSSGFPLCRYLTTLTASNGYAQSKTWITALSFGSRVHIRRRRWKILEMVIFMRCLRASDVFRDPSRMPHSCDHAWM